MRALDEVAAAIQFARPCRPVPILSSVQLDEQFLGPLALPQWQAVQQWLECPLPALEFAGGHWFLPEGFTTIWDVVDVALVAHRDWLPPDLGTVAEWRNAQIFAALRQCLARAAGVKPSTVNRTTRLSDLFG